MTIAMYKMALYDDMFYIAIFINILLAGILIYCLTNSGQATIREARPDPHVTLFAIIGYMFFLPLAVIHWESWPTKIQKSLTVTFTLILVIIICCALIRCRDTDRPPGS